MFTLSFKSFSFQPPLNDHKKLCINIQMEDGTLHQTEPFTYIPHKTAILKDVSDFISLYIEDNSYLLFEICEYNDKEFNRHKSIGKETVRINKIEKMSQEVEIPTIYGADAVIHVKFSASSSLLDMFDEAEEEKKKSRFERVFARGNAMKLAKMIPLLHQVVLSLSPLALMKNALFDFFLWKNPHKTFLLSVGLTIGIFLGRYLIALGLFAFGLLGDHFIPTIVKVKPLEETTQGNLRVYKRNAKFLKDIIKILLVFSTYYKRLFECPDKSFFFQLLVKVRKFAIFIAPFFLICNWQMIFVCGLWGALLYFTKQGRKYMIIFYYTFSRFIDRLNKYLFATLTTHINLIPKPKETPKPANTKTTNTPNVTNTLDATTNTTTILNEETCLLADDIDEPSHNTTVLGANLVEPELVPVKSKKFPEERTFVVYENQRWYIGKGWHPQLLPGERPSWSDDLGRTEIKKEDFCLPGKDWKWESGWSVIISSYTDMEGWEYASRFSKFQDPLRKKSFIQSVRRRKWIRSCLCSGSEDIFNEHSNKI